MKSDIERQSGPGDSPAGGAPRNGEATVRLASGLQNYHSRRYAAAIEDFTRAIELRPDYFGGYFHRANAYCEMEQYDKALNDFKAVIRLTPLAYQAYIGLGDCYAHTGDYLSALDSMNTAIKINPTQPDGYLWRGIVLMDYDDTLGSAIEDFTTVLSINPANDSAYSNRSACYYGLKEYGLALSDIENALRLCSEEPDYHYARAMIVTQLGHREEALRDIDTAIAISPMNEEYQQTKKAICLYFCCDDPDADFRDRDLNINPRKTLH